MKGSGFLGSVPVDKVEPGDTLLARGKKLVVEAVEAWTVSFTDGTAIEFRPATTTLRFGR